MHTALEAESQQYWAAQFDDIDALDQYIEDLLGPAPRASGGDSDLRPSSMPPVTITLSDSETEKHWSERRTLEWSELCDLLRTHAVGSKSGECFFPASFRTQRRIASDAERIDLLVLDSDCGHTCGEIERELRRKGFAGIVASTWSHLSKQTEVARSAWAKDCPGVECVVGADASAALAAKGYLPHVAAGAAVERLVTRTIKDRPTEYVVIQHAPCPKFRIALPLSRPWRAADYPDHAVASLDWKRLVGRTAAALGLQHDRSAEDVARLFYLPRRPKHGPDPETAIVDGDPVNPWDLPPVEDDSAKPTGPAPRVAATDPKNGETLDLTAWAAERGPFFKIVDALRARSSHVLLGHVSDGVKHHCSCPFGDEHSDPAADRATFVANAGSGKGTSGFVIHCRHAHCAGRDRLEFLARMIENGWLQVGDLADEQFLLADQHRLIAGGDIENGRAFAARYEDEFKHNNVSGEWLRWSGVRWDRCTRGEEVEAAKALAGDMLERATSKYRSAETDRNKGRQKAALDLFRSRARVASMLDMARTEPAIVVSPDAFDTDPMLLGVKNGVLDLRTGELIPPDPTQRISRQAGPAFDSEATCPRWLRFLTDVQPDSSMRDFLQRAVGYTLTGLVDEEKWFFPHGTGANGKSVFANVLNALMGEYSVTVGATLLTKNRNESEAGRLVARLPGARLALANETRQGDVWDDQRMKELISRERISARKLYAEGFDFWPTHKMWVRGNNLPGVQDASDGFWRRILPIAFNRQIGDDEKVPDLDRQIIAAELPGVLNWAIDGCLKWRKGGLRVAVSIRQEAARYREETDVVALWREDCCRSDPEAKILVAAAYRSYVDFCREQGMGALSQPAFTRLMTAKGVGRCKGTGGKRMFAGFSLIEAVGSSFSDDEASDLI